MSEITITPPSIIGLSVTAPNVLALQVITKEPVVLTVGDVTIGAIALYSTTYNDKSLSNSSTTTQNVFPTATDTIALEANSVYAFEGSYVIGSGATTHTTAMGFSEFGNGTCHFTTLSSAVGAYATATRTQDVAAFEGSVGGAFNATTTATLLAVTFTGRITVVDATNFTPTITFSAGPTGTCAIKAGSFIKVTKLWTGESTAADPEWT